MTRRRTTTDRYGNGPLGTWSPLRPRAWIGDRSEATRHPLTERRDIGNVCGRGRESTETRPIDLQPSSFRAKQGLVDARPRGSPACDHR